MAKNIQINIKTATGYEVLYPQTTISQVDTLQSSLNSKLNLSGGTMTGPLLLNADPTQNMQAVTKQYVDVGTLNCKKFGPFVYSGTVTSSTSFSDYIFESKPEMYEFWQDNNVIIIKSDVIINSLNIIGGNFLINGIFNEPMYSYRIIISKNQSTNFLNKHLIDTWILNENNYNDKVKPSKDIQTERFLLSSDSTASITYNLQLLLYMYY